MLAPICLFTYNRPDETQQTVEALKRNLLAASSQLFIFIDGPKNETNTHKVNKVRQYAKTINGFNTVEIFESPINKGLANSIIEGVTQIIEKYGKVIVLEDDIISSPNFLDFMNQALDFYQYNDKIYSISGYTMDLPSLIKYNKDYYLSYRASSWGWATWIDRWLDVDWSANEYSSFKWNLRRQFGFMRGGSDMPYMLMKQMNGKIDSWAIRWAFHQFINGQLTIYPTESKIYNIGLGDNSTHTKTGSHFNPNNFITSNINKFNFDNSPSIDKNISREFRSVFSVYNRIKNRILKI
jgi:hypothetical protein